ncbi:unnamed protein product [Brassica oleracea var. botrytis]
MIVLVFAMVCGLYICSVFLKQLVSKPHNLFELVSLLGFITQSQRLSIGK